MRSTENSGLVVGVDTHRDTHTAAVCDRAGQALAVGVFAADPPGYAAVLAWARQEAGEAGLAWAIEGTRHYGLGLARYLTAAGQQVEEIDASKHAGKRRNGKSEGTTATTFASRGQRLEPTPDEAAALASPEPDSSALGAFNDRLVAEGYRVFAGSLAAPGIATVVNRGGEALFTDGPFVESKEYLGGLWIVEAADLDVALKLAADGSKACNRKVRGAAVRVIPVPARSSGAWRLTEDHRPSDRVSRSRSSPAEGP